MTASGPARRRALALLFYALSGALAQPVQAQTKYPSRAVRMIVPFPPGQAADLFGRMLAHRLSSAWGQNVVVENRGGGAGIPAMMAAKNAAPDGYTVVMGTTQTLSVNPSMYADLPYDPLKDFVPVSNVVVAPLVIAAHPSFQPRSVSELVAAARKSPGELVIAVPGQGTSQHLTAELFKSRAGIELRAVAYKGSGPAMIDLIGGQVPLMMDSLASAFPHIRSGRIRVVAVTTARRVPQLPEVPTVAESGYPGFEGLGWAGIVVPAATPRAIVENLSVSIRNALENPDLKAGIIARGSIPDPRTPAEYAEFIRAETIKWARVAQEAGVRLEE
jgi:tripartite-type tricarboxylate transporter receptor subunit TctC